MQIFSKRVIIIVTNTVSHTHWPVSGLLYSRLRISASWASTLRISFMLLRSWTLQNITVLGQRSRQSVISLSLSLLVLPQHAIAISRCQVFAVWADTDGPDARPGFRCLSIPRLDLWIRTCYTLWIQQGAGVPVDVDYIQKILYRNEGDRK